MEKKRRTTVRTLSDATVGEYTVTSTTVAESTVLDPNNATVFENIVPENIVDDSSTASQPNTTETMENDMEVLQSVVLQQKRASYEEKAMALLIEEALLRARNYRAKASVESSGARKNVSAVLDTGAGSNVLKENFLLYAWAKHAAKIKATRLRSAANTQSEVNGVIRLEV